LPGAFVPDIERQQALVLWALTPARLVDVLRDGSSKGLLAAPHVGFFNAGVAAEGMLAAVVAGWLERQTHPNRLAP
jgi:hypothetical protein